MSAREIVRPYSEWPACPTPDCENNVCLWAATYLCHPCSVRLLGQDEMDRRYAATRLSATDKRWNGIPYSPGAAE